MSEIMETNQNKIKPFKSAAEQTESWMLLFDMLLAAHERREAEKTAELPDFNAVMHNLLERGNASFQDGIDLPLNALILKFGLSPFEAFCVMLAFAAETDRKYESVFALFNNIPEIKKPTLGLLAELFLLITGESITAVNSEAHFTAYSENAVMRFLFESFADKPELSRLSAPLSLNKTALYYLNQSNLPPDDLNPYCKIYPYEIFDGENEPLICHKSETEKLIAVIKNQYEEQELTCLLNIHGQAGVGKRFILRRACVDLKRDIIFADYSYLIQNPFNQIRKHADLLIAYCILHDSLLCLENFNV
ncbi:MAG: hypothetical protein FWG44_07380, partial [Oscillospiraceae bacterium]|nr:hypothetical protein [Oscillospiraceae bacterium]